MYFVKKISFCLILLFPICTGNSQTVDPQYEVGTWRDFKQCAVSFTFDDNCYNQLTVAMPIFDKYGLKMTLFTVIDRVNDWSALEAAALNGHEIASHTETHPLLSTLTNDEQITEFKDSQNSINSHIQNQKCLTIAYPNCDCGNPSICSQYYIAGRSCGDIIESKSPPNFMGIRSLICGTEGSVKRASDFISRINSAAASAGWAVFMLHSIDIEPGPDWSPVSSTELDGALAYLSQNKDKYWEATFYDVVRYIKERNNVSVYEISANDSLITFSVTTDLDLSIYNYPVSVRRVIPDDWYSESVFKGGSLINSEIGEINNQKYITFDIAPGSDEISIKRVYAMPVEINSFTGSVLSNTVKLSWTTATEVNNYGFDIERRIYTKKNNRQDPDINFRNSPWTKIGFVKGYGNSNAPKEYRFADPSPTGGNKFEYRLKQIDNDGKFEYSGSIETDINLTQYELFQNYPNPFNPSTTIKYAVPYESSVGIFIYNIAGKKVIEFKEGIKETGYYNLRWKPVNLSSGVYFYSIIAESVDGRNKYLKTMKMLYIK